MISPKRLSYSLQTKTYTRLRVAGHLQSHTDQIHAVQFSADGRYFASGDDSGILVV